MYATDEYLYSIFGFAIIAEMVGLLCFPKIAAKISREKVYAFACGLPIVGFAAVMGIRVLMLVIPIILAFASLGIYKKYYTLKGGKMEEITRKVNEMRVKKQTA